MQGDQDFQKLIKSMKPILNEGEYVFCTLTQIDSIPYNEIINYFREEEGISIILPRHSADKLNLKYTYIAGWITLTVHSSLDVVGLTAFFSKALTDAKISCNVVAAYYHDHIFVPIRDAQRALEVLYQLSKTEF